MTYAEVQQLLSREEIQKFEATSCMRWRTKLYFETWGQHHERVLAAILKGIQIVNTPMSGPKDSQHSPKQQARAFARTMGRVRALMELEANPILDSKKEEHGTKTN